MALFLPTYFSPISQFSILWDLDEVFFEVEDNYQKRSYRNRCYIYGANGKQLLTVPIGHPNNTTRKKTKDTLVDNSVSWQQQHLKSLRSAYNSSPFFEFLEADLHQFFSKNYKYLIDLNIDSFLFIKDLLELNTEFNTTTSYSDVIEKDYRFLGDIKAQTNINFQPYSQVFDDKFGFIANLSILDLIFMEGSNAITVLASSGKNKGN